MNELNNFLEEMEEDKEFAKQERLQESRASNYEAGAYEFDYDEEDECDEDYDYDSEYEEDE